MAQHPDFDTTELVQVVSIQIVADLAPEELDMFHEVYSTYVSNPSAFEQQEGSDVPLAFGVGEALTIWSPIAIAFVIDVIKFLAEEVADAFKTESADALRAKIANMFRSKEVSDTAIGMGTGISTSATNPVPIQHEVETQVDAAAVSLTQAQLEQIRKLALKQARIWGIERAEAAKMADALIGQLALSAA